VLAVHTSNAAYTDVDFTLTSQSSSQTTIAPRFVATNGYEQQVIWYVKAGDYQLSLSYDGLGLEKCQVGSSVLTSGAIIFCLNSHTFFFFFTERCASDSDSTV
jgi:hypothetical protein